MEIQLGVNETHDQHHTGLFVLDQDLNLDLHYEDRQVYLSWAANRRRRRYDHANLTG